MKVLIWIGCFLQRLYSTPYQVTQGLKVGYLIFYFAVYFVAKKLCAKWDEHKEAKTEKKMV